MNDESAKPAYDFAAEYSGKASAYARDWAPVLVRLTGPLLAALPLAAAQRVLDVGTGSGGHLSTLQSAAPGATLFGVDIALGMLQEAKRRANARFVCLDASALVFRPASFDVAISTFILQHVPDPAGVFREILQALKPGGAIGLATWGAKDAMPGAEIWTEELDRAGAGEDPRPEENHRELVDAPDKVERLLDEAGFTSIRTWAVIGHLPWRCDDLMSAQSSVCAPSRRLRTLAPDDRERCMTRVRRRIDALTPEEMDYQPEIVFSLARRPG